MQASGSDYSQFKQHVFQIVNDVVCIFSQVVPLFLWRRIPFVSLTISVQAVEAPIQPSILLDSIDFRNFLSSFGFN